MIDTNDESRLMCSVNGCINKWTVNMGKPMCSKHQWSDPSEWGSLTKNIVAEKYLGSVPNYYDPKDEF